MHPLPAHCRRRTEAMRLLDTFGVDPQTRPDLANVACAKARREEADQFMVQALRDPVKSRAIMERAQRLLDEANTLDDTARFERIETAIGACEWFAAWGRKEEDLQAWRDQLRPGSPPEVVFAAIEALGLAVLWPPAWERWPAFDELRAIASAARLADEIALVILRCEASWRWAARWALAPGERTNALIALTRLEDLRSGKSLGRPSHVNPVTVRITYRVLLLRLCRALLLFLQWRGSDPDADVASVAAQAARLPQGKFRAYVLDERDQLRERLPGLKETVRRWTAETCNVDPKTISHLLKVDQAARAWETPLLRRAASAFPK